MFEETIGLKQVKLSSNVSFECCLFSLHILVKVQKQIH